MELWLHVELVSFMSGLAAQYITASWAAPEVLKNNKYTEKADVYSYGVCLWEFFVRKDPYEGMPAFQVKDVVQHCLKKRTDYLCCGHPEPPPYYSWFVSSRIRKIGTSCYDQWFWLFRCVIAGKQTQIHGQTLKRLFFDWNKCNSARWLNCPLWYSCCIIIVMIIPVLIYHKIFAIWQKSLNQLYRKTTNTTQCQITKRNWAILFSEAILPFPLPYSSSFPFHFHDCHVGEAGTVGACWGCAAKTAKPAHSPAAQLTVRLRNKPTTSTRTA